MSKKLFVGSLSWDTTDEGLHEAFAQFGEIAEAKVITDRDSNKLESSNVMLSMPWYWHIALGGFAFGAVYMATDPVSACQTDTGRWVYGLLIGFVTWVIRVINPAFPEGIMLAILFANIFAPIIDYFVVRSNVKRRRTRCV